MELGRHRKSFLYERIEVIMNLSILFTVPEAYQLGPLQCRTLPNRICVRQLHSIIYDS
jgi:hypothetical protein